MTQVLTTTQLPGTIITLVGGDGNPFQTEAIAAAIGAASSEASTQTATNAGPLGPGSPENVTSLAYTSKGSGFIIMVAFMSGTADTAGAVVTVSMGADAPAGVATAATSVTAGGDSWAICVVGTVLVTPGTTHNFQVQAAASAGNVTIPTNRARLVALELN